MKKTDRLYPVIILVLYFGREPWDGTKNLKELLKQENYPEAVSYTHLTLPTKA